MDTRAKIIDLARARTLAKGRILFCGYFDVLTADLVRAMRTAPSSVIAVVVDPPDPLLSSGARAELAASLSMVDYVLLLNGAALDQVITDLQPDKTIRAEIDDQRRSAALIEHVHRRQKS